MKCSNCRNEMEKVKYDVGFGILIDSYTCSNCHHNFTNEKILDEAMEKLREKMSIKVKLLKVGTGLGLRLPNEVVRSMGLKTGKEVEIIQQKNQLIIKEKTR